jgi:phenylalanyl-tRNA synthetase beta chain
VDAYDAVDLANAVVDALALVTASFEPDEVPGWRSGHAAWIVVDGARVGAVGELDPAVATAAGLSGPVVAFTADVDALVAAPRRDRTFVAPSPYPPASIDLAFVIPDGVTAGAVTATISAAVPDLLEHVRVFDEFRRDELGIDHRSIAVRLRFRAPDRTLTDVEVGDLRERCISAVTGAHRAELRG